MQLILRIRTAWPRLGVAVAMTLALGGNASQAAGQLAEFPLKISENGRYFVDHARKAFLYQADTAPWLFYRLTFEDTESYLENRRLKGFTAIQLQLLPSNLALKNCVGHGPLLKPEGLEQPDDGFFDRAEYIAEMAERKGMLLNIAPAWLGSGDGGWGGIMRSNGPARCRELGRYIGKRFSNHVNVIWTLGGEVEPGECRAEVNALAEGIRDSAPLQWMTAQAGAPSSAAQVYGRESWLTVNSTCTYAPEVTTMERPQFHVYAAALSEWNRTPIRPFILIESTPENGYGAKPQWIRRQAYWALLRGAAGHAYRESHILGMGADWKDGLNQPGAVQLALLKKLFDSIAWPALVPDRRHRWVVAGYGTYFDVADKREHQTLGTDYVTTAGAPDGSLMVSYCPTAATLTVQLNQFSRPVTARWFDPVSGAFRPAAESALLNAGTHDFQTPGANSGGDTDWVLVLERSYR